MSVRSLFNKCIKNTEYKGTIKISRIFVCTPRKEIQKVFSGEVKTRKVFINSRSLKHIYDRHIFDKKVPQDFYFILKNIENIINNPDRIYIDRFGKRGDFIFVKTIDTRIFMCSIEIINHEQAEIVSSCLTGEKYISKFTLLWS